MGCVVIGAHEGPNRTNNKTLWAHPPTRLPCYITEVTASSLVAQPSISSDLEIGTSISWLKGGSTPFPPLPPTTFVANFLVPPPYLWLPISFGVILSSWRVVLIYLLFFLIFFSHVFFSPPNFFLFKLGGPDPWLGGPMARVNQHPPAHHPSTGWCPLCLSSGWTLTELTSGFTLVTHSITSRSYTYRKISQKIDDFQVSRWWFISSSLCKDYFLLPTS